VSATALKSMHTIHVQPAVCCQQCPDAYWVCTTRWAVLILYVAAYPWSWYQSVTVAQWWLTTAYNRSVGMDTQVSLLINHKTWAVFWWDKTNRAIASLAVLFQLSMQAGTVYLLACNSDPGGLPGCGFAQFWECVLARWANGLQLVCMDRSVKQDCIKAHCTMTDCSSGVTADIQHNF